MGKNHKRISMFSIIAVAITTFNLGYSYLISNRLISGVAFLICFVMLIIDFLPTFVKTIPQSDIGKFRKQKENAYLQGL